MPIVALSTTLHNAKPSSFRQLFGILYYRIRMVNGMKNQSCLDYVYSMALVVKDAFGDIGDCLLENINTSLDYGIGFLKEFKNCTDC